MQMSKNTVHKTNKKNTRKQKQKQKICCSNALALTLVQPCRCPILFLSCSQSQCCLSAGEKVSFFVGQWKNKKVKKKNREFHCIWTFFPQSPYQFLCWRVYVIKKSALGKHPTSNLNLLNLKYVDKAAAELWVEVQIEQMSFVLLLLQNLTMSKIRCFICVFTFIYYHHKVKTNLGEDVSGCALLFALLLCGLCLLSCFL